MGYEDVLRQRATLAGEQFTLRLKAGMVAWAEVETATALLAESAEITPGQRVLILEGGCGALAGWAARRGAAVETCDDSLVAERMTRASLEANTLAGVTIHAAAYPPPDRQGSFDVVLLTLPKGRAYTQALLHVAAAALKPDGRLYLAGPNDAGAKASVKDAAAILGQAATIRTKGRNRVAIAVRRGTASPDSAALTAPAAFEALRLRLFWTPGVFSRDGLDGGTAYLLDTLDAGLCAERRVLDVGCGSGAIGLHAAQLGASAVDLVDASRLAVACTAAGIRANGLAATCRVLASDLYADLEAPPYDLILSNPPFHAGHAVDTDAATALIGGARDRLASGGRLRLVANAFLPYDRLLADTFGAERVRVVAEDTRFRVLEGLK